MRLAGWGKIGEGSQKKNPGKVGTDRRNLFLGGVNFGKGCLLAQGKERRGIVTMCKETRREKNPQKENLIRGDGMFPEKRKL